MSNEKIEDMIVKDKENISPREFLELAKYHITRAGCEDLFEYIVNGSDFLEAPASSEFHLARKGGLIQHSFNVFRSLMDIDNRLKLECNMQTIALVSLFHDLCKANFYKEDVRNRKIDGKWHQVPYYSIDDKDPYGHGEKSVILLQQWMKLSKEEILAIRYHMGAWASEGFAQRKALSAAMNQSKLLKALMLADQTATYFMEDEA